MTKRDLFRDGFKAEDFDLGDFGKSFDPYSDEGRLALVYVKEFLIKVSDQANAILKEALSESPTAYFPINDSAHEGKLVCIKPLGFDQKELDKIVAIEEIEEKK